MLVPFLVPFGCIIMLPLALACTPIDRTQAYKLVCSFAAVFIPPPVAWNTLSLIDWAPGFFWLLRSQNCVRTFRRHDMPNTFRDLKQKLKVMADANQINIQSHSQFHVVVEHQNRRCSLLYNGSKN